MASQSAEVNTRLDTKVPGPMIVNDKESQVREDDTHPLEWTRTMNRTLRSNISLWDTQLMGPTKPVVWPASPYLDRYRDPLLPHCSSSVSPDYTT